MDSSRKSHRPARGPVDQVGDLAASVKQYARQETLEPIKGAIRWVGVGSTAALSLGLALVFAALGVLRLSQDLGGTVHADATAPLRQRTECLRQPLARWSQ